MRFLEKKWGWHLLIEAKKKQTLKEN